MDQDFPFPFLVVLLTWWAKTFLLWKWVWKQHISTVRAISMWHTWPLTQILLENTEHPFTTGACATSEVIFCSCSTAVFLLSCLGTPFGCSGDPGSWVVLRVPKSWTFIGMSTPKKGSAKEEHRGRWKSSWVWESSHHNCSFSDENLLALSWFPQADRNDNTKQLQNLS